MNNIYRVIWNASMNVWQAVSEIGRSGGKTQSVRDGSGVSGQGAVRSFAATALMMACAMAHAGAPTLPVQGVGVQTNALVTNDSPTKMTITQEGPRAVLNWETFNVGPGNTVEFKQNYGSGAIALNRVIGVGGVGGVGTAISRSLIEGNIVANGQIFLINPAGITFTKGAQVDVGGIVASTRDLKMTDTEFLASTDGKYNFVKVSAETLDASIINNGVIMAKTTDGAPGYVVFIAAKIVNAVDVADTDKVGGKISGKNVILSAGDDVLLSIADGIPAITVTTETKDALIENHGWITATNGQVLLTTGAVEQLLKAAINNTGVIEADSISISGTDGTAITLDAVKDNTSGILKSRLEAKAPGTGAMPSIALTAGSITLGKDNELLATHAAAAIKVIAATGAVSNAGSIITGEDGSTGTVVLTATAGDVTGAATSKILSGTITLDAGKGIDLKGTDATTRSQLIASVGSVTLKATEAISNDGLIETPAVTGETIVFTGAKAITLGANSALNAKAADAAIDLTASTGDVSNAGSIITGEDGATGTVVLTATAGNVTGAATSKILSGTITLDAGKGIDLKGTDATTRSQLIASVGSVTLKATEAISNDGLIETPAVTGETILFTGAKSISLGANSDLRAKAEGATIDLTASAGNISNAGSITTGAEGKTGTVIMKAGTDELQPTGSIEIAATGVVKSGTVTMSAQGGDATIDGLVQAKAADGGVISITAANILLNSTAILDASGTMAGAVTTNAGYKLDAQDGAQVKTLSTGEDKGTWTVSAGDVHVRAVVVTVEDDTSDPSKKITITGPSGVDSTASTPGALVTRVNLLDTDQIVDASALVGNFSKIQKAAFKGNQAQTTLSVGKQGWNIVVDEAIEKPAAVIGAKGTKLEGQSLPQDVTLTVYASPTDTLPPESRKLAGGGLGLRFNKNQFSLDISAAWRQQGGKPLADISSDPKPRVTGTAGYRF